MPTTCTPQSLYGPYYQTRFCGASIMSMSVSAGWNEQTSELTVDVVEDCSTVNRRIEYGTDLEATIVSDADEFSEPHIGCPAYFRIGDTITDAGEFERNPEGGFEFAGIIQSWTRRMDTNGNPTYSLKLTDPRAILENSYVIVSDFGESVDVVPPGGNRVLATPNIINAYAWLEALDADCRDKCGFYPAHVPDEDPYCLGGFQQGTVVGSLTGGFGGSGANERGIRWNWLKKALGVLVSANQIPYTVGSGRYTVSTDPYSPHGRLIYRGGGNKISSTSGKRLLPGCGVLGPTPQDTSGRYARYMVDLTEIPFAPEYYRITGPMISFTELISQVCEAAGCDYYVELLPVKGLGGVQLVIKVRVVKRRTQPKLGEIQSFVDTQDFVVSKTFGQELANQPNSIFIFGAKRQDYAEQEQHTPTTSTLPAKLNIIPAGGFDTEGTPIKVTYGNPIGGSSGDQWWWYLDFRRINLSLNTTISNYAWVSESELRASLGTYDVWKDFEISRKVAARTIIGTWLTSWLGITQPSVASVVDRGFGDLENSAVNQNDDTDPSSYAARDALALYNWIRAFATDYYGKKFLVKIAGVCRDYDYGSGTASPYYSDDPATDGAWATGTTVLGLANPGSYTDFFKDDTGKTQPILKFYSATNKINTEALSENSYIANSSSNIVWVQATLDEKWLVGYPFYLESNEHAWAQVTIPDIVTTFPTSRMIQQARRGMSVIAPTSNSFGDAGFNEAAVNNTDQLDKNQVGFISDGGSLPINAGIPLRSNTRCYGPWGNIATASFDNDLFQPEEPVAGKLQVEHDDGLAPWEYGGIGMMNDAAIDKVSLATTEMQISERGQITIPGYPNKRIGSALNTTDTSSYDMGFSQEQFQFLPGVSFVFFKVNLGGAQQGAASISNVNVNVSPQGIQTELSLTTFSPVFGRFSKSNADRLRRIGKQGLSISRKMRARGALKSALATGNSRAFDRAKAMGGGRAPQSTSIWFCGKFSQTDSTKKTVVANDANAQAYYGSAYNHTAIMTMDGLLRPVSKEGGGSLPQYASYANHCGGDGNSYSVAPGPPQSGISPSSIIITDLDPLANPYSVDADSISVRDVNANKVGHDWEGVARSTASSMGSQTGTLGFDGEVGYTSDYRFLALRGPLMLQSWGYDLQGFPIPNSADSSQIPKTDYENLTNSFNGNWLQNSSMWPVAPVDLRFDRRRGVWTTPPAFGMYVVTVASENIGPGDHGRGWITDGNGDDPPYAEGNPADARSITNLYNKGTGNLTEGDKVFAYYDTNACQYWAIPTNAGGGSLSLQDRPYCEYTPTAATGSGGFCHDTDCLVLGWGLQADYHATGTEISAPFYVGSRSEANRTDLIGIGAGLATEQGTGVDDSCDQTLTLSMVCQNNSYCADPDDYYCPSTGVKGFQWGPGLETHSGVGPGGVNTVNVRKTLTIGADRNSTAKGKYISTIGLGCGLKVEPGNTCGADQAKQSTSCSIEVDNTAPYSEEAHEIEVVCGIKCDSDGIEIVSKYLVFSDCGLFMGTKQSNGRGQSIGALNTTFAGVDCEESSSSRTTTNIATFAS